MTLSTVAAVAAFLFLAISSAHAQDSTAVVPSLRDSLDYLVQLKSGDRFRGRFVRDNGSSVSIRTEFGVVDVPKELIEKFYPAEGSYTYGRRPHHFLMPTGSPNGPGAFFSNYELGFLYGGFGLGNGATITAGMTIIPGISFSSQLFHVGAKFTVERSSAADLALGATYTWITGKYPYAHIYGVATFPIGSGRYSAMMFYRATGEQIAPIGITFNDVDTTTFTLFYEGNIGVAFGFDAPAFGREDINFIGEIWNNDVSKPGNTVSMLGVRLTNERLSADFGVAVFTAPFIVPVFNFMYRIH